MSVKRMSREAEATQWLMQLESYDTLPPFSRVFYRLLCNWVRGSTEHDYKLQLALILLLRIEIRRHQAVQQIVQQGRFDLEALVRVASLTRDAVRRLEKAVSHIKPQTRTQSIARHLILAECRYHLGRNGEVVEELRKAVEEGCRHPIVQFALGYNLYCHALRTHLPMGLFKKSSEPTDREAFERTCREAIEAFRGGLEGNLFDAQLHWWIGLICELLDSREDARKAYMEAMSIDPATFAAAAKKKIRGLFFAVPDAMTREESDRLQKLPPINKGDLATAANLLARIRHLPEDVFPDVEGEEKES